MLNERQQQGHPASNPPADPAADFRARKLAQMQAERGAAPQSRNTPSDPAPNDPPPDPNLEEEDDGYPGEDGQLPLDGEGDGDLGDEPVDLPEVSEEAAAILAEIPPELQGKVGELVASLEQEKSVLEERYENLHSKTTKTWQAMAQERRQTVEAFEKAKVLGAFHLNLRQQQLASWNQVNWAEAAKNPEEHQRLVQQYQTDMRAAQMLQQYEENVVQEYEKQRQLASRQAAQISKEILPTVIPDWGGEKYAELREVAEAMGFAPEEFDEITDWRMMVLFDTASSMRKAPKVSQKPTRRNGTGKQPTRSQNQRPQPRNAQGQYQSARQAAFSNPGDRMSFREMKQRQLAMERGRRR